MRANKIKIEVEGRDSLTECDVKLVAEINMKLGTKVTTNILDRGRHVKEEESLEVPTFDFYTALNKEGDLVSNLINYISKFKGHGGKRAI